jgi:hypothetical protein
VPLHSQILLCNRNKLLKLRESNKWKLLFFLKYVLHFSLKALSEAYFPLTNTERLTQEVRVYIHENCILISVDFSQNRNGPTKFNKSAKCQMWLKIHFVAVKLLNTNRQAGRLAGRQAGRQGQGEAIGAFLQLLVCASAKLRAFSRRSNCRYISRACWFQVSKHVHISYFLP